MKKRMFSLICTLALCLGLLPATALANTGSTWNSKDITLFVGNVRLSGPGVTESEVTGYYIVGSSALRHKPRSFR